MTEIQVVPVSDAILPAAADVLTTAFVKEAITSYWIGDINQPMLESMKRINAGRMEVYRVAGMHEVAAMADGSVLGVATLKSPYAKMNKRGMLRKILELLPHVARYLRHINRRAVQIGLAGRKPAELPQPYYMLEYIGVHPEHQGRGVARLLLDHVHAIADSDQTAAGVYLITGEQKTRSIYERFGYRVIAARPAGAITVYHMFRPRPDQ